MLLSQMFCLLAAVTVTWQSRGKKRAADGAGGAAKKAKSSAESFLLPDGGPNMPALKADDAEELVRDACVYVLCMYICCCYTITMVFCLYDSFLSCVLGLRQAGLTTEFYLLPSTLFSRLFCSIRMTNPRTIYPPSPSS
jgi:hypothetical protein